MAAKGVQTGKKRFSPRKGTLLRELLLLALRPEGVVNTDLHKYRPSHRTNLESIYGYKFKVYYGFPKKGSHTIFLIGRYYDKYHKHKDFFSNAQNAKRRVIVAPKIITANTKKHLTFLRSIGFKIIY